MTYDFDTVISRKKTASLKWDEKDMVVGKVAKHEIKGNEIIYPDDIK